MKHLIVFVLIALCLLPAVSDAFVFISDDQAVIATPIDDDVIASGGTILVNAPVRSLIATGGSIIVNAPVAGDVIAAGGTIIVGADVDGKVLAAGGSIGINGTVENVFLTGGTVVLGSSATVLRDAVISAGSVTNAGTVVRNLSVSAGTFENPGTAGAITYEQQGGPDMPGGFGLLSLLVTVGFLFLGVILIQIFPEEFAHVVREVVTNPIIKTIVGFFGVIISTLILLVIAITVIGLPIAAVLGMFFLVAVLLSSLFVAFALGDVVVSRLRWKTGVTAIFVLGFVLLQISYLIPVLGWLVQVGAVSLGYGAFLYALRDAWRVYSGAA
ncbi:hypothetical protein ABH15_07130 [Methanoculleus taiwanensis]|uniref:DUF342 domain-containing protein n=1 Tax=Methanoculleus taiwanensis TaxID=1550565 RepID=A0A498H138_9EURY|nr:hypothetical protein [Methanoculleus taiwanensis]RXE56542.1 hypothetical protein ABH15_07130 [Methanoculleus taiwanensis]